MPVLIWSAILIELIRLATLNILCLFLLQVVNGLIWHYENKSSTTAITALKESLAPKAHVKRDNVWKTIYAKELVVGDKICIFPGDLLPADCVLGIGELVIDQSMLTGETVPVTRGEGSKAYMGSICKKGEIEAFVCQTGKNTFFQKSASLMSEVQSIGRIQKVMKKLTVVLMIISSVIVCIIMTVLLEKGIEFLETLAVCAIYLILSMPIAVQVVSATILAVGSRRLNEKGVVVSQLSAIEELACMQVLCISRSGFLSKPKGKALDPVLIESNNMQEVLLAAYLCSKKLQTAQNSIDKAICALTASKLKAPLDHYEEEDFEPFDPKTKRSLSLVRNSLNGEVFWCCKGSPQAVLRLTSKPELEGPISRHVIKLASMGCSCIAVARTLPLSGQKALHWEFCGLVPVLFPAPPDVSAALRSVQKLAVKLSVLSGSPAPVLKHVCQELGLGDLVFSADLLNSDASTVQTELVESLVAYADGFAEVFPEHKFTLVKILQRQKKRVGITGVGISDAPALKRAHVGIAAFGATDAARAAADVIYNRPGLKTVVSSVRKAREIFERAETYCLYRIYCSFQLLFFFFLTAVLINPAEYQCAGSSGCRNVPNAVVLPVLSLVIVTLFNDATMIAIAFDRPRAARKPKKWKVGVMFLLSSVLASISLLSSMIFLLLTLDHMDPSNPNKFLSFFLIDNLKYEEILTGIFLKLSISNYLTVFSVRCNGSLVLSMPGKTLLCVGFVSTLITTLFSKYWFLNIEVNTSTRISLESISWKMVGFIWGFDLFVLFWQELAKLAVMKAVEIYGTYRQDSVLSKLIFYEAVLGYRQNQSWRIAIKI
jgi:H+-transporting ATPase